MCGIVGIASEEPVARTITEALKRLEYRGYDSAGVATLINGTIERRRVKGKLDGLVGSLNESPLPGETGIGHTRWATHGAPSAENAHPHSTGDVAIVHNGIIENYRALRDRLTDHGMRFETPTDSEVIAVLATYYYRDQGLAPPEVIERVLGDLQGAFSIAMIFKGHEGMVMGARVGSPLVVGFGEGETYLASDTIALTGLTNRVTYLEEGDRVILEGGTVTFHDHKGKRVSRAPQTLVLSSTLADKGNHRHFMAKEIYEQPEAVTHTLAQFIDYETNRIELPGDVPFDFASVSKLTMVACGTAYLAALVARDWFERLARIPVEVDIASEFRYREPIMPVQKEQKGQGGIALFISQSGETADTLAALRYCREQGQKTAAIINATNSSMARDADYIFPTLAGPEIGVASTKAFTCQLGVLAALAVAAARIRGTIDEEEERVMAEELVAIPHQIADCLTLSGVIEGHAHSLSAAYSVFYIGRGICWPLALEGALKLKETSYIHAEGYAAGELKHGPIALIDEHVPTVAIAPSTMLFEKTLSNMQEIHARGGRLFVLTDEKGAGVVADIADGIIKLPEAGLLAMPILYTIPIQLLAYHAAVARGTDVDQPRNLAKSVTVE
ncbi:MAG: glutamine--fructose-6-phosphate transaminase (isomerizing) [Parvularculales bacterium]